MGDNIVCFVANIGNRDIVIEEYPINSHEVKEKTKNIVDDFEKYFSRITLPVIEKAITRILKEEGKIDQIFLIATNQEQSKYSKSDTLYSAEVIKKYLMKKYPKQLPVINKQFRIFPINTDPHDFDSMLEKYKEILNNLSYNLNETKFYLSVTSATQAMNTGLMHNGMELFAEKCNLIYSSESSKLAQILNLPNTLANKIKMKELKLLLSKYSYHGASYILEELDLDSKSKEVLLNLCNYAYQRLCYNLNEAENSLLNCEKLVTGKTKQTIVTLLNQVYEPDLNWQIQELIYNSYIKLLNGEYVDFLGRVFRFLEAIAAPLLTNLGVELNNRGRIKADWLNKNPDIKDALDVYFLQKYKKNFDISVTINRNSCLAILHHMSKSNEDIKETIKEIEVLSTLADMRNKSIVAHDFKGISKNDIEDNLHDSIESIPGRMLKLYSAMTNEDIQFNNPFDDINKLIEACLE